MPSSKRPARGGGRSTEDPLSGRRQKSVRVKSARGRSSGSTRWLQRQLNDPYVAAAKDLGFRSRAAFKLTEIDDRIHVLKPGARVVDLGAAPGGWSQVAAERVRAEKGSGHVVALDVTPVEPVPGVVILEGDMMAAETPARIVEALEGSADVVLSDMAAPATGHRSTDHMRVVALCEVAIDLAEQVLAPGGAFVAKVFQGGTEAGLLQRLKQRFAVVRHVKPKASRAESPELYVVATGFKGPSG